MKKNYNRIPVSTLEKIQNIKSKYLKVGFIKKIPKKDINFKDYSDFLLIISDKNYQSGISVLPPINKGRYSKYNQLGRKFKRFDLPKVEKWFSHDIYPYGDTSKSLVTATYSKKVRAQEIWDPEFIKIRIQLKNEDAYNYYFSLEIDDVINKESGDFNKILLSSINLLQENFGNFDVFSEEGFDQEAINTLYVNWEFFPPEHMDITRLVKNYNNKTPMEQKTINERYDTICELKPIQFIKGTNKFNQYFGAKLKNDVVVLENTNLGNALYVFYESWEELSKHSRTELISLNLDIVVRIQHTGNWKVVLKKVIENKIGSYSC